MAFHFIFAPLLRLRLSMERQRALHLRQASLRVMRMQNRLETLDRFLDDSQVADQQRLRAGVTAAELQFATMSRQQLRRLHEQFEAESKKLEAARQTALSEYQQAYREREILATLRRQQRLEYQREELRRLQREVDATHLLQRWRSR